MKWASFRCWLAAYLLVFGSLRNYPTALKDWRFDASSILTQTDGYFFTFRPAPIDILVLLAIIASAILLVTSVILLVRSGLNYRKQNAPPNRHWAVLPLSLAGVCVLSTLASLNYTLINSLPPLPWGRSVLVPLLRYLFNTFLVRPDSLTLYSLLAMLLSLPPKKRPPLNDFG